MLVSIFFSVAFYNLANREIQRIEIRIERQQQDPFFNPFFRPPVVTISDLEDTHKRLVLILILINAGILMLAGAAGYFLAGRTLKPIADMVAEQNRFITDASHELRTPLTALRSEIEVNLRDKDLDLPQAKALLKSNLEEVESLQLLSDNLLQLAQSHYQNGIGVFKQVSLSDVIESAQRKVQPLAVKKEIIIHSDTGIFTLSGDRQSLIQLFVILFDNAIKYSGERKKISVTTNTIDHSVSIAVSDEGIGIRKKDLEHIFDRFYRADTSRTKQAIAGYGLGLSIAKDIVAMHHGVISVRSKLEKGTTFTIQLPYIKQ